MSWNLHQHLGLNTNAAKVQMHNNTRMHSFFIDPCFSIPSITSTDLSMPVGIDP